MFKRINHYWKLFEAGRSSLLELEINLHAHEICNERAIINRQIQSRIRFLALELETPRDLQNRLLTAPTLHP